MRIRWPGMKTRCLTYTSVARRSFRGESRYGAEVFHAHSQSSCRKLVQLRSSTLVSILKVLRYRARPPSVGDFRSISSVAFRSRERHSRRPAAPVIAASADAYSVLSPSHQLGAKLQVRMCSVYKVNLRFRSVAAALRSAPNLMRQQFLL